MVGERGRWAFAHTCFRATPSTAAGAPAGLPVAAGAPITGTAPAANNTPSLSAAAPVFADVEKITGLQPAQALDLLRSVLTSLNSIVSAQPQAAPVPPATAAGVGPLSYAGALTAAPILPEVGTSAAAAAADEIQRLRQQLVGVTAHLEAAQNEAVRVRAELSEMESLQDRQNVVEMAGDDLRNESDVHRRKLLDPNALRMSAGSTLNAYITDFRNTLTVAGSTCMAPAMLVATFIRGLTSELQSSVVHDLALMRDPTLNDAIQAAVNAQKVLFAVATNHVGRRPPAPHVAAFVPPKQMNRLRTPPGLAGGPPPAPRGPYWDVSSSSGSGGHRGSRHSSQGGVRHAGRAALAPPATAPVCPAPAAGGSTLPIPGYACHHCWNPNHFRDYCNLKHLPADEARRVSGYPRPASLGPPSRHANPPGDLPPRPQKRDRSPPGKGGWKQQGSRAQLTKLISEFEDVFAPFNKLPPQRPVGHTIPLQPGCKPPALPSYKMSQPELLEMKKQVAAFLEQGIIEPSSSPYAAPVLFVKKKSRKRLLEGEEATVQQQQPVVQQPQQEPQPQLVLEQPLPPPPVPLHPLHAVNMTEQLLTAYAADEAFASMVDQYDQDQHGLYRTRGRNQIVVPNCPELKTRILVEMHDAQFAGHVGITKTLERISRMFWWPRMRSESDGQTERYNRTLEEMLRHYISPAQSDWPFFLSLAEFAVNNSWQESIQSTPFLVNTGQSPLTPALLELPGEVYCPTARRLSEWWQSNVKQARHFMELAQRRQAYMANKGRKEVEYHTGLLVLLSTKNLRMKPGKAKKLLPRFIGPFKVLEHVGPVAVRLDLPQAMARMHPVFHVSLLRPYTSEHPHLPPPVEWLDETPLYEVEKLLAHRGVRAGKARGYLVKWQGYDDSYNTWEPRNNLVNCLEVLTAYNAVHGFEGAGGPAVPPSQRGSRQDYGDRSSFYFYHRDQPAHTPTLISSLQLPTQPGQPADLTTPAGVKAACRAFQEHYSAAKPTRVYATKPVDTAARATLLGSLTSHLTPTQARAAKGPDGSPLLSEEELGRALQGCAHSKAPGLDGLPMEVYDRLWVELGRPLRAMLREALEDTTDPAPLVEFLTGIITLVPKAGKPRDQVAGYRPITLLNCDVRLVARAVEDRLQLPLDLLDTMEAMGLCQEGHVRWAQLLHRGATSQVLVNGHLTDSPWQPLTHSLLADPSRGLSMWVITDPTAPPSRGISPWLQAHVAALAELKLSRAVPPASQCFFSVMAEQARGQEQGGASGVGRGGGRARGRAGAGGEGVEEVEGIEEQGAGLLGA
ncbi:hypothetical protein QJQ45_007808 [Haematococcus lacustris]|nr:hypothetical protein QJQ45_007808 [Haematococcus lacustris]